MTWAAVAIGAGSVISAGVGYASSNKAGKAAQAGSNASIAETRRQFDTIQGNLAPVVNLGKGAAETLSRLYGYGPSSPSTAPSGSLYSPSSGTSGMSAGNLVKDATKGVLWGLVDPVGGTFSQIKTGAKLFGIGGSSHGDEKRNLNAFLAENQVYDLGDGKLALADGTVFPRDELQSLAGAWYGATYAPDGNQEGWQRTYNDQKAGLVSKYGRTVSGQDQAQTTPAVAATGKPDMSVFFTSPDYQFRQQEGEKAIDRLAAARGGFQSGGAGKELVRYNSNLASGEYGAFVDRLLAQAGLGTTGIGASASAGMNAAGMIGNASMNAGNARASSYLQAGQAINNSVQGGISNYLLSRYLASAPAMAPAAAPAAASAGLPMALNYNGPLYGGGLA